MSRIQAVLVGYLRYLPQRQIATSLDCAVGNGLPAGQSLPQVIQDSVHLLSGYPPPTVISERAGVQKCRQAAGTIAMDGLPGGETAHLQAGIGRHLPDGLAPGPGEDGAQVAPGTRRQI